MAEVPTEVVTFARIVVRAFYPPEYVVIADAVLRANNYCAHHDLARRLKMPPKELRAVLVRMVHHRIMKSEKRMQKRINYRDEKRPARNVNTEFWYVPLTEVLDSFLYRVDVISKQIDAKLKAHRDQQPYRCASCQTKYSLLDIVSSMNDQHEFVCTRLGVRADRRPMPCNGIIKEEDNQAQRKELTEMQKHFEADLKPLRERAAKCATLNIPSHPLDGADEATWGEVVPETIGIHGEAVDAEGLTAEMASLVGGDTSKPQSVTEAEQETEAARPEPEPDAPIPEKPSWFKDSNQAADDADDDWYDDGIVQNVNTSATGTAASFAPDDDAKAYYNQFLDQVGANGSSVDPVGTDADTIEKGEESEKETTENLPSKSPDDSGTSAMIEPMVTVAGKSYRLSEITEEMQERMTSEEYDAYFSKAREHADDDGDEFE